MLRGVVSPAMNDHPSPYDNAREAFVEHRRRHGAPPRLPVELLARAADLVRAALPIEMRRRLARVPT
jgi:hypothetical protein